LAFEDAVNPTSLLLLTQLPRIVRLASAAEARFSAVDTGWIVTALNRALGGKAACTLQKKLLTFSATKLA
jgi:hypothetical protein